MKIINDEMCEWINTSDYEVLYIYRENRDYPKVIDEYIDTIEGRTEATIFVNELNKYKLNPAHLYFRVDFILPSSREIECNKL